MSQKTIQVDQFLINVLQPEIDVLNLSLVSMEERGYANKAITDTRRKLNKLISIYTFLKEYAYGDEEVEDSTIRDMMELVGAANLSTKSLGPIVQATRESLDINRNRSNYNAARVYLNGEILLSNTLTMTDTPATFKIFASNNSDRLSVTVNITGISPVTYTGVKNVVIPNIMLNAADYIVFNVQTYRNNELLLDSELTYSIIYPNCTELSYWAGATIERFTISDTDLNESSDVRITPNAGTGPGIELLTYDWTINNLDPEDEYMFREPVTQKVTTAVGDAHLLIMVPTELEISEVKEVIFDLDTGDEIPEDAVDMTQGVHYEIFSFDSEIKNYNCVYFRDLTSLTFPDRTIQFNIQTA